MVTANRAKHTSIPIIAAAAVLNSSHRRRSEDFRPEAVSLVSRHLGGS